MSDKPYPQPWRVLREAALRLRRAPALSRSEWPLAEIKFILTEQMPFGAAMRAYDIVAEVLASRPAAFESVGQRSCAKCGGVDLYIQFKREGDYEGGVWEGSQRKHVWEPYTGKTDTSRPWDQFWLADSLAITCRTCQFRWVEAPHDARSAPAAASTACPSCGGEIETAPAIGGGVLSVHTCSKHLPASHPVESEPGDKVDTQLLEFAAQVFEGHTSASRLTYRERQLIAKAIRSQQRAVESEPSVHFPTLLEQLQDVDDALSIIENTLKGPNGDRLTEARGTLDSAIRAVDAEVAKLEKASGLAVRCPTENDK